jgi:hypothetical protein
MPEEHMGKIFNVVPWLGDEVVKWGVWLRWEESASGGGM